MQSPGNAVIKLSHRHRAIMEHMIANPEASNAEVARAFGVTEPWLSSLIHSELFQLELRYLQDVAFSELTVSIKDRINNLAHESLKRLQQRLELNVVTNDTLVDVAELALKSLGFGAPKTQAPGPLAPVFNQQINNFGSAPIDAKLLADARDRMLRVVPLQLVDADAERIRSASEGPQEVTQDVQRDGNSNDDLGAQAGEPPATPDESGARIARSADESARLAHASD